jgi:hypothetical protein
MPPSTVKDRLATLFLRSNRQSNSTVHRSSPGNAPQQRETKQGEKWLRKTIRKIWETYLQLWKQRNEIVHGIQEGDKQTSHRLRLTARLERCYQYQDQLTVNNPRNKIFYKTIKEMQNEDPRLIQSWLRICERIIRVHKKEINKPNKTKTMMEQYLQWRPSQQANKRNKKARLVTTSKI